jgi:hypothetical protein
VRARAPLRAGTALGGLRATTTTHAELEALCAAAGARAGAGAPEGAAHALALASFSHEFEALNNGSSSAAATADPQAHAPPQLFACALGCANALSAVNDAQAAAAAASGAAARENNCAFVELLVRGRPLVALVTLRDIGTNEELLAARGQRFWSRVEALRARLLHAQRCAAVAVQLAPPRAAVAPHAYAAHAPLARVVQRAACALLPPCDSLRAHAAAWACAARAREAAARASRAAAAKQPAQPAQPCRSGCENETDSAGGGTSSACGGGGDAVAAFFAPGAALTTLQTAVAFDPPPRRRQPLAPRAPPQEQPRGARGTRGGGDDDWRALPLVRRKRIAPVPALVPAKVARVDAAVPAVPQARLSPATPCAVTSDGAASELLAHIRAQQARYERPQVPPLALSAVFAAASALLARAAPKQAPAGGDAAPAALQVQQPCAAAAHALQRPAA